VDDEPSLQRIQLTDNMLNVIRSADCIIVSDYNKGFLQVEDLFTIANAAKFSVIDTKKKGLSHSVLNEFSLIKVNESEYLANSNVLSMLSDRVVVTLGAIGAKWKDEVFSSPHPKETIDVSGAGDTFLAGFITKFLSKSSIPEAIVYANHLSSIVVSRKGVVIP
jgi:sugar/nucleoside kinase (ribokinase family)